MPAVRQAHWHRGRCSGKLRGRYSACRGACFRARNASRGRSRRATGDGLWPAGAVSGRRTQDHSVSRASKAESRRKAERTTHAHAARRPQQPRRATQQTALDFLSAPPAQRTLRDEVPAQIDCEQAVAAPMHRFVASSIDAAFILIGFGLFVAISQLMGSSFGTGKLFWVFVGACFALIAAFYGLIFAIAGRETAGMRSTDLQLVTFDGLPVEGRTRAVRLAATWLSFCSGGLGLIWALADEENLTWQDHIVKDISGRKDWFGGNCSTLTRIPL